MNENETNGPIETGLPKSLSQEMIDNYNNAVAAQVNPQSAPQNVQPSQMAAPKIDMTKLANLDIIAPGDNTFQKYQVSNVIRRKRQGGGKFSFVEPEIIPLPSGGRLYKGVTDDPDVLNGFIKMYPMTVKEEEILSTSRFLKSGSATRMVIDNCIASGIEAKDILLFDSNFLLFYLRSISYGDEYKFKVKCGNSACEQEFEHTVHISKLEFEELPESVTEPITVKLPKSRYTVSFVLARMFHSEEIYQRNLKKKKSTDDTDDRMVDNLIATTLKIIAPDGTEVPRKDWEEFYESLPGIDRAELSEKSNFTTGVDKLKGVKCPYCETDYSGSIPIGAEFFRF